MNKINVTRSSMPPFEEYCEEIRELWFSRWLTNMGVKHIALQEELKKYLDVEKIELLTNGHMALEMVLQAMCLPKGGEVITTPYTFASTTHAIVRNGLEPVFCDIDPLTYTIDVSKIEALLTPKTCAILPVHVYGNICNVEGIQSIASKNDLKVIYDAAHAFGEKYKGIGIGTLGDASCFSFHATKVYHTIEGGAVTFHEAALGQRLYELKNFGIQDSENVTAVGANAKMNEFCAAMGLCNLRHIDHEIAKRKQIYDIYMERLDGISGIQVNHIQPDVVSNYAYFPVVFNEEILGYTRDDVFTQLLNKGIYTRKYFYPLTSDFACYRDVFCGKSTPIAEKIAHSVLTLPIYPDLSIDIVEEICNDILGIN